MGFANFYGRTLSEYAKYGLGLVYNIPGSLEFGAEYYSYQKLGYYYNWSGIRYSFP
jgi:hypothetical protein